MVQQIEDFFKQREEISVKWYLELRALRYLDWKEYKAKYLTGEHRISQATAELIRYPEDEIKARTHKETEERKKAFYESITAKVGEIKTAYYLSIGVDGTINGSVFGEKGGVKITSIIAGGYNIQVAHYRVLVKEIKQK